MSAKTPTVSTYQPPAAPPIPMREDWPNLAPAAKPSRQSPFRTVLIVGSKGDRHAVRVVVEGRDEQAVNQVARMLTGL